MAHHLASSVDGSGTVTIKSNNTNETQTVDVGLPFGIGLSNDCVTSIKVPVGTKLVLLSACLDISNFDAAFQCKLMMRTGREDSMDKNEWLCVCNYLGRERGGSDLPVSTSLGLEAAGPCVIEMRLQGYSMGGVNVFGNVVSAGGKIGGLVPDDFMTVCRQEAQVKAPSNLNGCVSLFDGNAGSSNRLRRFMWVLWGRVSPMTKLVLHASRTLAILGMLSIFGCLGALTSPIPTTAAAPTTARLLQTTDTLSTSSIPTVSPSSLFDPSSISSPVPSFEGGCVDLTVALLLPPSSSGYEIYWNIASTAEILVDPWISASYKVDAGSPVENTFVLESSNGTNSNNKTVCLPEGPFNFSVHQTCPNGVCFRDFVPYILSSNGRHLKCGLYYPNPDDFEFDLDYTSSEATIELLSSTSNSDTEEGPDDSGCHSLPCISTNEMSCLEEKLMPLKCFLGGTYFDDVCGDFLEESCRTRDALGFEQNNTNSSDLEYFIATFPVKVDIICQYHQCAYENFQEKNWNEYYACECINDSSGCCLENKNNDSEGFTLSTSCQCIFEPECEVGNFDQCSIAAQYCYMANDESLKCTHMKSACRNSDNYIFCEEAQAACCGSGDFTCGCDIWEPECQKNPSNYTCEPAADSCSNNEVFTYCLFYTYADEKLGYKSPDMDDACYTAAMWTGSDDESPYLNEIFKETGGDFWYNNTGWLSNDTSYCSWFGITCDDDGSVTRLDLRNNNLTGSFPDFWITALLHIQSLDFGKNRLSGIIEYYWFSSTPMLSHIDLSENYLSGEAEMLFSPATEYVNFSHNRFTSVSRMHEFKPSYITVQSVDLSYNSVGQNLTEIFSDLPPKINELDFSNNNILGTIPRSLPKLDYLTRLTLARNQLSGKLPDFERYFPRLRDLNLSNQGAEQSSVHLSGSIPDGLSNLFDLVTLDLSKNELSNSIPEKLANLPQLQILRLTSNKLFGAIPTQLGKLSETMRVLDLSSNFLTGTIPFELGDFVDAEVLLSNNKLPYPAPLSLCSISEFDLKNNVDMCPEGRKVLKDFYDTAKGIEWTNSTNWLDEYASICTWHGVGCNKNGEVNYLNLTNNALSGRLIDSIAHLPMLEVIELSDNDIKGTLPSSIGMLHNLTYLRLSYNAFTGEIPPQLGNLQYLQLLHLHGNRFRGEVVPLKSKFVTDSAFVSDCGVPTDFDQPLLCSECTMCCNYQEDCYPNKLTKIQEDGFESYTVFTWVFFTAVLGVSIILAGIVLLYGRFRRKEAYTDRSLRASVVRRDKKYALDKIGDDSVYKFFLGSTIHGWFTALAVIGLQIWLLYTFIFAAEFDLSDDKSDLVYTWRCPRDNIECSDKGDVNARGWLVFAILMTSHLLADLVNGVKMILLSAKPGHSVKTRIRFFIGGIFLSLITLFTLFASTIYNKAIATSNTEIIVNAVIILFITDLDEQFFGLLTAISPKWVERMSYKTSNSKEDDKDDDESTEDVKRRLAEMEEKCANQERRFEALETMLANGGNSTVGSLCRV